MSGLRNHIRRAAQSLFGKRPDVYLVKFDAYWHPYIPYALLHVGAHLKQAGFSYRILHNIWQNSAESELQSFAREVIAARPQWVGVSVITGRSAYFSARFSRLIKEHSTIPVVWGGIHPTIMPEQCLRQDYVDYVVLGEGEERAAELARCLRSGEDPSRLDGVGGKRDGEMFINPPAGKVNVDSIEIDWSSDLRPYLANGGLSYISSRGCPYRCDFCVNGALDNHAWRPVAEDRVLDDIAFLKRKYGIKYVHFNDDNFFVDRDRAFRILASVGLRWFAETRVNYLDEEFARRVKDTARCEKLMAGGESGSENVLKAIRKGHTREHMLEAARLIGVHKIPSSWSFIIGMPVESCADIRETFRFIKTLEGLAEAPFCKPGLYIPYPGTVLYDRAVELGFVPPDEPEGWIACERYTGANRATHEILTYPWVDNRKLVAALDLMRDREYEKIDRLFREDQA